MAGQEGAVEQLRFLDDDPPAGADDAGELAQCLARLLDVVEHVTAPDPVEARVGRVEPGGVPHAELQPRADGPVADELARRVGALRRWLDAHPRPPTASASQTAKSPAPQPTSRPREPSGRRRSAMSMRASGSWKRFIRSSDFVKGSVSGWVMRSPVLPKASREIVHDCHGLVEDRPNWRDLRSSARCPEPAWQKRWALCHC